MEPLINWKALLELNSPPPPPRPAKNGKNMWDDHADMYCQMAAMEAQYTERMLSLLDVSKEDTVLDVGCGPGRIAVPMAKRAGHVTAIDSAEKMLAHCRANAEKAGVTNLETRFLDWKTAVLGEDLPQHDIVIASRSVGLYDLQKLSSFAKKYAVISCWANAPCIPELLDRLFAGTSDRPPMRPDDRRLSYNINYNMVYDMGYEPNVRIVPDGFCRMYQSRQEAYDDLARLRPLAPEMRRRFEENVDGFLTETPEGILFEMKTRTYLMWWDVSSGHTK